MEKLQAKKFCLTTKSIVCEGVALIRGFDIYLSKRVSYDGERYVYSFAVKVFKNDAQIHVFEMDTVLEEDRLIDLIYGNNWLPKNLSRSDFLELKFDDRFADENIILNRKVKVSFEASGKKIIIAVSLTDDFETCCLVDGGDCRGWIKRIEERKKHKTDLRAGIISDRADDVDDDDRFPGGRRKLTDRDARRILNGWD